MKPLSSNQKSTTTLKIVNLVGLIVFFVIFLFFLSSNFTFMVLNFPKWAQIAYALATSSLYFFASYLSKRNSFRKDIRQAGTFSLAPWFGSFAIGLAIFIAVIDFETKAARIGLFTNYLFGVIGVLNAYSAIFISLFPQPIVEEETTPPDPLSSLPKNVREVVEEGKESIAITTIKVTAIGAILVLISTFFLSNTASPLTFLVLETLTAIIAIIIARRFAAYKWQKRARQSGILEEELKAAAKLAGLRWPKTKRR